MSATVIYFPKHRNGESVEDIQTTIARAESMARHPSNFKRKSLVCGHADHGCVTGIKCARD